jgi:hypothetical protein
MKTWIKFGLINAFLGLVIGIYLALTAIGDGYSVFAIGAPIAAFLTGCLFWKLMVKEKSSRRRVVFTGILTGIFSHYLTFVLINIGANICYWTTGKCTDSFGEPPANFFMMLGGAFIFSFFSLVFFGWLTVAYAIVTGLILKRMENKTNVA